MNAAIKSPDALELKGKPKLGSRFGRKAGFMVGTVLAIAMGLVVYGIATRDPAGIRGGESDGKNNLTPASSSGKKLYEGIGDGMMGRDTPQLNMAAAAPSASSATPEAANGNAAPKLESTGAQQMSSANGGQQQTSAPTPEEAAAARLRELREQERRKAIEADSGVKFGDTASAALAGPSSAVQDARNGAMQRLTGAPGAGGRLPDVAGLAGLKGGLGGGSDDPNLQARKEGFLAAAAEQESAESLRGTRRLATTAYELKAGTVIPAILKTGLNSDLPGEILGQVSENVYDTATGIHLLMPQGSTLVGRYDSRVAFGQDRALAVWDRCVFPDGSSVSLQGMGASDKAGYAGLEDKVNNHIWRLIGYGAISSAFASVFQITQRSSQQQTTINGVQSPSQVAAGEIARQYSQLGLQMAQKNLNIQPTIEVRPGFQFNVIVNKDVVFTEAYRDRSISR